MTTTTATDPDRADATREQDSPALAVEARGLVHRYRKQLALDGLDLSVPEGAAYLLVGPNGAGKTTTLKVLLNLVRPKQGSARVLGMDTSSRGPDVRAEIGWVPEGPEHPHGWAKVGKLLDLHGAYYSGWDPQYAARLGGILEIDAKRRLRTLSKGETRRVQLVMAMAHRPRLLLLDEPLEGLDPVIRERVVGLIAEHMAETPTTLLVSTHLIHEIDRLADHIGVIRKGRVIFERTRDEIDKRMRRYRAALPADWAGLPAMSEPVLRTTKRGRETEWTVWGEEEKVLVQLRASGAQVRDVSVPTLEEAVVTLVTTDEVPR